MDVVPLLAVTQTQWAGVGLDEGQQRSLVGSVPGVDMPDRERGIISGLGGIFAAPRRDLLLLQGSTIQRQDSCIVFRQQNGM